MAEHRTAESEIHKCGCSNIIAMSALTHSRSHCRFGLFHGVFATAAVRLLTGCSYRASELHMHGVCCNWKWVKNRMWNCISAYRLHPESASVRRQQQQPQLEIVSNGNRILQRYLLAATSCRSNRTQPNLLLPVNVQWNAIQWIQT